MWAAYCVPTGLVLLFLGVFRVRRTGTIDLDSDGMYVRGVFIDHRVSWGEIEKFEVRIRTGTFYRPTVCLADGKSFWLYGFTSRDDPEEAEATVFRLNTELKKHLGDSAGE